MLTIDTTDDAENMYFIHGPSHIAAGSATSVVIEARVWLISGSAAAPTRGPVSIVASFGTPSKVTSLFLEPGKIFPLADDEIINLDAGHVFGLVDLDLDTQDHPTVAYGLDDGVTLRYARKVADTWQGETVGTVFNPSPAVAFDGADVPVVLVPDDVALKFASRGAAGWSPLAPVDPQRVTNPQPWVGRDAAGNVEAFYHTDYGYRRAVLRGGVWTADPPFGSPPRSGGRPAVVMGANGQIHAAFENDNGSVWYEYFDGCKWSAAQTVDETGGPTSPTLAVDAAGNPHFTVLRPIKDSVTGKPTGYDLWYVHPRP